MKEVGCRVMMGRAGADDDMDAMASGLQVCKRNSSGLKLQGVCGDGTVSVCKREMGCTLQPARSGCRSPQGLIGTEIHRDCERWQRR